MYVLKRAQLLVADLAAHFTPFPGHPTPQLTSPLLAYETASLAAFADNVVPAVLHALGVCTWTEQLERRVSNGSDVADERTVAELRGLGVFACDETVRARV